MSDAPGQGGAAHAAVDGGAAAAADGAGAASKGEEAAADVGVAAAAAVAGYDPLGMAAAELSGGQEGAGEGAGAGVETVRRCRAPCLLPEVASAVTCTPCRPLIFGVAGRICLRCRPNSASVDRRRKVHS